MPRLILLGVFAVATATAAAQAPLTFEVASVKPNAAAGNNVFIDRTGLTGLFDFDFTWTPDQLPPPDAPDRIVLGGREIDLTGGVTIDPNGAALLTSLREQLGLRLEATRGPVEVLVVERIDRPTPD